MISRARTLEHARRFDSGRAIRFGVAGALLVGLIASAALLLNVPTVAEPSEPGGKGGGGHRPLLSDLRSVGAPWAFEGLAYLE